MSLRSYIKESSKVTINKTNDYVAFGGDVYVVVKDPLPENVDLKSVLSRLEKVTPKAFTYNLECIFVGEFDVLEQRQAQAIYLDGAIYITNEQSSEEDLYDDLVHEIAHVVEEMSSLEIYGDNLVEREYLQKKKKMFDILSQEGYDVYSDFDLYNVEFDSEYDEFLYNDVGYDRLAILTPNIFASPYAATSLSEYFANGYEHYLTGARKDVKELSPNLFAKLEDIFTISYGERNV